MPQSHLRCPPTRCCPHPAATSRVMRTLERGADQKNVNIRGAGKKHLPSEAECTADWTGRRALGEGSVRVDWQTWAEGRLGPRVSTLCARVLVRVLGASGSRDRFARCWLARRRDPLRCPTKKKKKKKKPGRTTARLPDLGGSEFVRQGRISASGLRREPPFLGSVARRGALPPCVLRACKGTRWSDLGLSGRTAVAPHRRARHPGMP